MATLAELLEEESALRTAWLAAIKGQSFSVPGLSKTRQSAESLRKQLDAVRDKIAALDTSEPVDTIEVVFEDQSDA